MEYDLSYLMKVAMCYGVCSVMTKPIFHNTGVAHGSEA